MTGFGALFRKDVKLALARPATFIFIALFALSAGALTFYTGRFFDANRADLTTFFRFLPWLFVIFTSALAMDALSAERRAGTAELLHALPLPSWHIVLSKWLTLWLSCLGALGLTMSLWLSVSWLGTPDHGAIIAGYFGTALLAAMMCALALAASARMKNQVLAFIGAFTANSLITLGPLPAFNSLPEPFSRAFANFSVPVHQAHFLRGVVSFDDVMFFVLLGAFGLYVASVLWRANRSAGVRIALAIAALLGLNAALATGPLRAARLDLSRAQLYTLSPPARAILRAQHGVTNWTFYFSRTLASQYPDIRSYGAQVEETLHSFVRASKGKIRLSVIDPGVDNPREDDALAAGIEALPTDRNVPLYFGLADAAQAVIIRFDPARATLLEYDLARALGHDRAQRPRIALYDGIDLAGKDWFLTGKKQSYLFEELEKRFSVDLLDPAFTATDLEGHIAMLVHPPAFKPAQEQALSDFVARGGHALIFLDPYSEASARPALNGLPKAGARMASKAPGFLISSGFGWTSARLVLDRDRAMPVQRNSGGNIRSLRQPAWIGALPATLAKDEPITSHLHRGLILASAAALSAKPKSGWKPLIWSSTNSALLEAEVFATDPDPEMLMSAPPFDGQIHWLGAIKGGLVVLGDADLLDDAFYVQNDPVFGPRAQADNADFVLNALDRLAGSNALLALRARSTPMRSLTRIDAMRSRAEQQLRQAEQTLGAQQGQQTRLALRTIRQKFHRQIRITETALEIFNIWLFPALVLILGGALSFWRRRQ